MLLKWTRYLKPEIEIADEDALREGPAILEGIASACDVPLVTPWRGKSCVAYSYRVYRMMQMRQTTVPNLIKDRLCSTDFVLRIGGTEIRALSKKPGEPVTKEEHRDVQATEKTFIEENAILLGKRVRIEGMVVREGEVWICRYRQITDLGEAPREKSSRSGRRRRRKAS